MRKTFIIVTICLLFSSCFPHRFVKTPELSGKVVEKTTKLPVENAILFFEQYPNNRVKTKKDGTFDLSENKEMGYFILLGPFDPVPPHGVLIISADGYRTVQLEIGFGKSIEENILMEKE